MPKKKQKLPKSCEPRKKNSYFPLFHSTASLIGIRIIVLYNPYITGQYKLPYIIQPLQEMFRGDHVASNSPQVVIMAAPIRRIPVTPWAWQAQRPEQVPEPAGNPGESRDPWHRDDISPL